MTHTKASQLIVLGNGFDLHCGLKSSYKDFLYYVITQRYTNYFSSDSEEASDRILSIIMCKHSSRVEEC